jgi:hypothetical protein
MSLRWCYNLRVTLMSTWAIVNRDIPNHAEAGWFVGIAAERTASQGYSATTLRLALP